MGGHQAVEAKLVPEELRAERVRDGYQVVSGALPHRGERVWLSPMAGAQFRDNAWFVADTVEDAYRPGWAYLWGCYVRDGRRVREYVHIAGLRVERVIDPGPWAGRHRR